MFKHIPLNRLRWLLAGLVLATAPVLAEDAAGVVRISDQETVSADNVTARGQSPGCVDGACVDPNCVGDACYSTGHGGLLGSLFGHGNGHGNGGLFGHGGLFAHGDCGVCPNCGQRIRWNALRGEYVCGCNRWGHHSHGPGHPLIGHYSIAYPVDPGYWDSRDSQVYAAPGYGGPVSVPLAPVVNYQYNYGWGVPSSRITPISRPAHYQPTGVTSYGGGPLFHHPY